MVLIPESGSIHPSDISIPSSRRGPSSAPFRRPPTASSRAPPFDCDRETSSSTPNPKKKNDPIGRHRQHQCQDHSGRKRTSRNALRALQEILGVPSYTSSELWIGERRNIRYSALDERESATATKKKKVAPEKHGDYQEEESRMKGEGRSTYRSSSWSSSRWSVSAAFKCSLSSASSRVRAMSSTRSQNASVPSCHCFFFFFLPRTLESAHVGTKERRK